MKYGKFYILYIYVRLSWKDIKMTFLNLNSMNMMNMFGGINAGGFGLSGLGMGGFGGGIFTNCFGDVEYDKVAGYAVANSLFSVGVQAYQSIKASKEPEVDYKQEKSNLNKQVAEQLEKLPGATVENYYTYEVESKYDNAISTANADIEAAKTSIANYENIINTLGAKKESEMTAAEKSQFDDAKQKKAELEESIADGGKLNEALKQAKEAKEARQEEIDEIISKIDKLLNEKDKVQDSLNLQSLQAADGNRLTRARKECMTETYDANNQATKADLKRAVYTFIKSKDTDEKRTAANKILEMVNSNKELGDKYSEQIDIIKKWLNDDSKKNKENKEA